MIIHISHLAFSMNQRNITSLTYSSYSAWNLSNLLRSILSLNWKLCHHQSFTTSQLDVCNSNTLVLRKNCLRKLWTLFKHPNFNINWTKQMRSKLNWKPCILMEKRPCREDLFQTYSERSNVFWLFTSASIINTFMYRSQ